MASKSRLAAFWRAATATKTSRASHWRGLVFRVAAASLIAWLIASAPVPRIEPYMWFAYVQVPIAIFLLICYLGKLLIDTFFFDHYRP